MSYGITDLDKLLKQNPDLVVENDTRLKPVIDLLASGQLTEQNAPRLPQPRKARKQPTAPITIVLDGERPVSWNKMYAGIHWNDRRKLKSSARLAIRTAMPRRLRDGQPLDQAVDIEVKAYFDSRPQDADNICSKLYIDGLKGCIIHDDNRRFVRRVSTVSLIDKERPRVEIVITPVPNL